jgi:CRP-like cAMP-binding protein
LYTGGTALAGLAAVLAPALAHALGLETTLVVVGLLLPVLAILAIPQFRRLDRSGQPPERPLRVLADVDLLCGLPTTSLEKLARRAEELDVASGTVVVREGGVGDRFYAIADGQVIVTRAGQELAVLGPGDYFGEVALARSTPRNATVTARGAARFVTLSGDAFVNSVTTTPDGFERLGQVVERRA